jgi:hypothetical protein
VLDSKIFLQLGAMYPISISRGALGGANNVFKVKKYCFLTEKRGCDRATSPLYVHLRFEICINIYGLRLKGQTNILSQN